MKYRIMTFSITADGGQLATGTVGAIGKYNPNSIKTALAQPYKASHPGTKIVVVFTEVKEVNEAEYNAAAVGFMRIDQ